jgi:hypothetical protein
MVDTKKQKEFHLILKEFLKVENAMPAVIIYSGNTEQAPSPADLEQMFSQDVLHHSKTTVIASRPITTTACRRVLKNIIDQEQIELKNYTCIDNIADTCLGDLRHAIMSLQFELSDIRRSNDTTSAKSKVNTNKMKKVRKKKRMKKNSSSLLVSGCGRDMSLGMLHSLGKLLRAKRVAENEKIEPNKKRTGSSNNSSSSSSSSTTVAKPVNDWNMDDWMLNSEREQQEGKNKNKNDSIIDEPFFSDDSGTSPTTKSFSATTTTHLVRPPLNFIPEQVVEGTGIHVTSVLDFVTHNGPEYYSEMNELDKFYEHLSDGDLVLSDHGNGGGTSNNTLSKWSKHYTASLTCGIVTSIVGRAVPVTNVHPSERIKQFKPVRRSTSIGIMKARQSNLKLLIQRRTYKNNNNLDTNMSSLCGKEFCVDTGPYSAIIATSSRSSSGGGSGMIQLLKDMSLYSHGSKYGKPGLGERDHNGGYIGTWNLQSRWNNNSSSNDSLGSLTVMADDDIDSF